MSSKVVLVTGCSNGGIGFALCEEFASQGCKVYATARRLEAMEGFAHASIERLALDVTNDANVQQVVASVIKREGRVDILVNNAGMMCHGPLLDVSTEHVTAAFDTNTVATLRTCKAVVPHMAACKSGLILNIGSIAGIVPTPWAGGYSATKAALYSLSQSLAMELRPLGLRVLHVDPGAVRSRIVANGLAGVPAPADSLWAAYRDAVLARVGASQGAASLPADAFAARVVREALRGRGAWAFPSYGYLTLAPTSRMFRVFAWLPRAFVLALLWWIVGGKPKAGAA